MALYEALACCVADTPRRRSATGPWREINRVVSRCRLAGPLRAVMCVVSPRGPTPQGDATRAPPVRMDAGVLMSLLGLSREARVMVSDGHARQPGIARRSSNGCLSAAGRDRMPSGCLMAVKLTTGLSAWWPQGSAAGFRKAGQS